MYRTTIYSAKKFIMTWGEVDLTIGRSKEDFLTCTRSGEDPVQTESDLDGNVAVWQNMDNRHDYIFTCRQDSPANDHLSAIFNAALLSGTLGLIVKPLTVKDDPQNGTTIHFDQNCVLVKNPDPVWSEKPTNRSWKFIATDPDRYDGGALAV